MKRNTLYIAVVSVFAALGMMVPAAQGAGADDIAALAARHADGQADRQIDRQAGRQADRRLGRQADRRLDRRTDRQADRQADRKLERQEDRQADRPMDYRMRIIDGIGHGRAGETNHRSPRGGGDAGRRGPGRGIVTAAGTPAAINLV